MQGSFSREKLVVSASEAIGSTATEIARTQLIIFRLTLVINLSDNDIRQPLRLSSHDMIMIVIKNLMT